MRARLIYDWLSYGKKPLHNQVHNSSLFEVCVKKEWEEEEEEEEEGEEKQKTNKQTKN